MSSLSSEVRTSLSDDNSLLHNFEPAKVQLSNDSPNIPKESFNQLPNMKKKNESVIQDSRQENNEHSISSWRAPGWEKKSLKLAAAGVGRFRC